MAFAALNDTLMATGMRNFDRSLDGKRSGSNFMYVQEGSLLWFLNSISLKEVGVFIIFVALARMVYFVISLGKDGRAALLDMLSPLIVIIFVQGPFLYFFGWEVFHHNSKGVYFLVEHGIVSIETYEPFANSAEAVFRFIIMDVILRIIGFVLLLALGLFGLYIAAYVIGVPFFIIRDILRKFGIVKSKENTTAAPDQLSDATPPSPEISSTTVDNDKIGARTNQETKK